MAGGWKGSDRRARLPSYWPSLQRRVITAEPYCRCSGCPRCFDGGPIGGSRERRPGCVRPSTAADHIHRGNDHSRKNLRGICAPCHAWKSSQEGNQAKQRTTQFGQPIPKHPGQL